MKPDKKSPGLGLILTGLLVVIWIVQMVETYNATGAIAIYQAGGLFCALVLGVLEIQGKR
jgi:hypothetical protein